GAYRKNSSATQVRELVLANLQFVPVREPVRLDPPAVDVGAIQGSAVVEVVVAAPADEDRVVTGDRDIVQEDVAVRPAPDAQPVAFERKALPRATAAGANDECRSPSHHVTQL